MTHVYKQSGARLGSYPLALGEKAIARGYITSLRREGGARAISRGKALEIRARPTFLRGAFKPSRAVSFCFFRPRGTLYRNRKREEKKAARGIERNLASMVYYLKLQRRGAAG